jgi:hypothetical protein
MFYDFRCFRDQPLNYFLMNELQAEFLRFETFEIAKIPSKHRGLLLFNSIKF